MRGPNEQHLFSRVPSTNVQRSVFNRTHGHKTTFDANYLVPIYVDEVLPGDTFKLSVNAFARLTTPLFPLMDNLYLDFFFFFVPNRLLWSNWQKFMGEQANPGDSVNYIVPTVQAPPGPNYYMVGSLADYFGIPTAIANITPNALPFRAYNLIYNEWFRDENLINSAPKNVGDGPDLPSDYTLRKRAKPHDYFTSCLPWPQKGTAVSIPLGTTANVTVSPVTPGTSYPTFNAGTANQPLLHGAIGDSAVHQAAGNLNANLKWDDPALKGVADLSTATAATINALRLAFQTQKMLERDARGGTRYTEILRSHFGVISPDARLQRPEYLGGGTTPIQVNSVPQTSASGLTGGTTKQGSLTAFATANASRIGFAKSFVEHGYIIGIVNARADVTYQQGLHRMWSRSTRLDFYWPALANLGEQAVLNKEIFYNNDANDNLAFGYQERWAEYRYFPSIITGKFRSTYGTSLDPWHLAEKFTTLPGLNQTFIEQAAPMSRVVAVTTEPHFYFDSLFQISAARCMPTYSVPGLIDHF